jgi:hypothetical protein
MYKGNWFREGSGTPPTMFLEHFEGWVSKVMTKNAEIPVVFRVPRKSARYRREVAAAENLIQLSENDLTLAQEALDLLFTDRRLIKNRHTVLWLESDFLVAVAKAKANRQAKLQKEQVEKTAFEDAINREKLF